MNKDIRIFGEKKHPLNINNSGTLNEQNLLFSKKTMLFDLVRDYADVLVKHKQYYPENDISEVDLTVDFVILDTKTYKKILKIIEGLPKERQDTVDKYLKFPKLEP